MGVSGRSSVATGKIAVGLGTLNLTNINTVTSVNTRSGPTFGQALTPGGNTATLPFIPGRNLQFTLNYSFYWFNGFFRSLGGCSGPKRGRVLRVNLHEMREERSMRRAVVVTVGVVLAVASTSATD